MLNKILLPFLPLGISVIILFGCGSPNKMTIQEARQVTIEIQNTSVAPPPRRIDDVVNLMEQEGHFDPKILAYHIGIADQTIPDDRPPVSLAKQYLRRGISARELGRDQQALQDLKKALACTEIKPGKKHPQIEASLYASILGHLGTSAFLGGNFQKAIDLHNQSLQAHPGSQSYFVLTTIYLAIGDYAAADSIQAKGNQFINGVFSKGNGERRDWAIIHRYGMESAILESKGLYDDAESVTREMIRFMEDPRRRDRTIGNYPRAYLLRKLTWVKILQKKGDLLDAEIQVRDALNQSIGLFGAASHYTTWFVTRLGDILIQQGRINEAEQMFIALKNIHKKADPSLTLDSWSKIGQFEGHLAIARGDYRRARDIFIQASRSLSEDRYTFKTHFLMDPSISFSLIMSGDPEGALQILNPMIDSKRSYLGIANYQSAELVALAAMADSLQGRKDDAMQAFREAMPILLKSGSHDHSIIRIRLNAIVDAYLNLLYDVYRSSDTTDDTIRIQETMFRVCQSARNSSVQQALLMSLCRQMTDNPDLAELIRKEQDARRHLDVLQETLSNVLAADPQQRNANGIADLKLSISRLNQAVQVMTEAIDKQFPEYQKMVAPEPTASDALADLIEPDETLLFIYVSEKRTYSWAVTHDKPVQFNSIALGRRDLTSSIESLRNQVAPSPETLGRIPDFDVPLAFGLYQQLIAPFESALEGKTKLIVIASRPLDIIPFSVFPTEDYIRRQPGQELFAEYRSVPWLIRKIAVGHCPTVGTFAELRRLPQNRGHRLTFVGFGDPIFNRQEMGGTPFNHSFRGPSHLPDISMRRLRNATKGNIDQEKLSSCKLEDLTRLEDTADEVRNIAVSVGADPQTDIYLGVQASENRVKSMALSDRRIIVFATHALIPKDLDGLTQPALALSSPQVTGESGDGLLTMQEIFGLKLNADWVVLSACNTAAGEDSGAESVSGLGRAFFFAGSRALLVSMWPVETTSAGKLTTGLFKNWKKTEPTKAGAMRQAIIDLIDSPGLLDDQNGKVIASYAHPFFWAPFVVVGDGR